MNIIKSLLIVAVAVLALLLCSDREPLTVTDIDGNVYHTVKIGKQIWTVENLRVTTFNDGTPISMVKDGDKWKKLTTPAYCWNKNDISYKQQYGALYNWYVVEKGKLAPKGWHVPTNEEWGTLTENDWTVFSFPLGGSRSQHGVFYRFCITDFWWSTTDLDASSAYGCMTYRSRRLSFIRDFFDKRYGMSIRLVKD